MTDYLPRELTPRLLRALQHLPVVVLSGLRQTGKSTLLQWENPMPETDATVSEKVYASPPSEPDDDFWLEQGGRMLAESLTTVRTAASALLSALGVLQGIYLGILGFAKFLHETLPWWHKTLFILPLLIWLFGLYYCLDVVMTKRLTLYLHSPSDIRAKSTELLLEKQRHLEGAFWCFTGGLLAAFGLLLFGLGVSAG